MKPVLVRFARGALPLAVTLAMLAACNKDPPPKPTTDEAPKSTPVPSDMVFNDFIPQGQGGGKGLSVRTDGGLEGGLAEATGEVPSGGAPGSTDAPDPAGDQSKLRVTDPGAEPRTARHYTFVANRSDRRLLTMRQTVNTPQGPQEVAMAFTVDFVPKQVKPTGARFEMKILKVEIPDVPPAQKAQAAQAFAAFSGMTGSFDVSPQGEVGEIDFQADEKLQNPQVARMAQAVLQGLQEFVTFLLPPLPTAPIGVGAKWESHDERAEGGAKQMSSRKFTLKDFANDGGTVLSDLVVKLPKTAIPARPGGPSGSVEMEAKGAYTYTFKLDRVSTRVEGALDSKQSVEEKGKPPMTVAAKAKYLLEPAK